MSHNEFEDDKEFKEVFAKLKMIKNMDLTPPDPNYFSTLLARTRQRIEQEQEPRSMAREFWRKSFFAFLQTPIVTLSMAIILIVLFFSVSEIGELSLLRQKNVYSSLAQELELLGPHSTHPEDDTFLLEELNDLNDEQLNNLLKSLET